MEKISIEFGDNLNDSIDEIYNHGLFTPQAQHLNSESKLQKSYNYGPPTQIRHQTLNLSEGYEPYYKPINLEDVKISTLG